MTLSVGIAVHRYDRNEGTGGYVTELLPRISTQHRVTLYAASVACEVPPNVEVVCVPAVMRRAYTAILTFPPALRRVRRPHDVFHAQGWTSDSADVVTTHIVMRAWREASRAARLRPPPGERFLGWFVERREAEMLRHAGHVIAPSAKVQQELARLYGRTTAVTTVHHGFPQVRPAGDRHAARRALGLPERAFVALVAGDVRKTLAASLGAARSAPTAHLAVASASPEHTARKRAAEMGLSDRFHWLGCVADMTQAYSAADVLLHPTIYDSFALVVAEAMAHGLPPIVSRNAGIAELITHLESGWVVQGDNVSGTAEALTTLAADRAIHTRIAAGAQAAAARRTWDDVARETLAVYDCAAGSQ